MVIIKHVINTVIMPGQQADVGAVLSSPEGGHPHAIMALSALRASCASRPQRPLSLLSAY